MTWVELTRAELGEMLVGDYVEQATDADMEALAIQWPEAYNAIMALLGRIQRGEQHEATSDWDVSLATLVEEARP